MTNFISLIGAPTDIGAGVRGASMGPEALRVAGIAAMLESQGLAVRDCGDLRGPPNPQQGPEGGYRISARSRNGTARYTMACTANCSNRACRF